MSGLEIVGRSSSHFTRTARIFALELGVVHAFRPVFDIMSLERETFADNPALKVPILLDASGPLFGTENICRELMRRSGKAASVVMRGALADRLVANTEELILHVMTTEVTLITAAMSGDSRPPPAKMQRSLENSLEHLERNVDAVLAALPATRSLSFLEVTLFCVVRHLPFRKLADVSRFTRLGAFADEFGAREGAHATEYRFDQP